MKIHGMCLVKNEADIIGQSLKAATEWCDFIYVFDNGSTDGTWEKVLDLAKVHEQIIPFKQEDKPFRDNLRAEIFNSYRSNCSEEDWWCCLDADEIYIDNPQIFLSKVPKDYQLVLSASIVYYFTDKDLDLYTQNPSLYSDDVSIENKIRYYLNDWSEPRFFRYNKDLIWNEDDKKNTGWPSAIFHASIYPVRIRLKHYQYRSPQQIQKRLDTRRESIDSGKFLHESRPNWKITLESMKNNPSQLAKGYREANILHAGRDWRERILDASKLDYDAHDGKYVIRESLMPRYDSHLKLVPQYGHKFSPSKLIPFKLKNLMKKLKKPSLPLHIQ
jgi:glycosyltransferase involved in cell wall biosynthesis